MSELIPFTTNDVMARIIKIRGQEVLLDRDVAELYGVETKRINEALRNNPDKFPEGYVFTLQRSEKQEVVENFDRLKTLKHSTVEPRAFTERGLYMLATILKSKQATSTTLAIIDSFVKLREISRNIAALHQEQDKEKQKSLVQRTGELMNDLLLDDGETTETESTVEINLVALKFKHTVKRVKKKEKEDVSIGVIPEPRRICRTFATSNSFLFTLTLSLVSSNSSFAFLMFFF